MKKINILPAALAVLMSTGALAQTTQTEITLQPDACRGKDSHLFMVNAIPGSENGNYATSEEFVPLAWTFNGSLGYCRAIIDFVDLANIPQGTTVTHAYLSLYGKPSSGTAPQGNYGTNDCYVQRVTSSWAENTVTWANQPTTTATNQVSLPGSGSTQFNYNVIDLDVTTLVQDIINQAPADRHGFMIRLQNESIYKSLVFASSDYSDSSKRPKLRVGLNACGLDSGARRSVAPQGKVYTPDVIDLNGKVQTGVSAQVKSNLSSGLVTVNYELSKDGKTIVEIVSIDGSVLKALEVDGTAGKHTKTITLDGPLLKNKMAVLVVKQGTVKTANPFVISQ